MLGMIPEVKPKDQGRSTVSLPASLAGVACRLAGGACGVGTVIKQQVGESSLEEEGLWLPPEMCAEGEGRLQQVFCCSDRNGIGGLGLEGMRAW